MQRKKRVLASLLSFLLFMLALALIVCFIVRYVNKDDLNSDTFCVECNGEKYSNADSNVLVLPIGEKVRLNVNGTDSYKVSVVPNVTEETDFIYTVDDKGYYYGKEDLSGLIIRNSDVFASCFYIECSEDNFLENVLSRMWGGKEVTLHGTVQHPYLLKVTNENDETIQIAFSYFSGIQLNFAEISF